MDLRDPRSGTWTLNLGLRSQTQLRQDICQVDPGVLNSGFFLPLPRLGRLITSPNIASQRAQELTSLRPRDLGPRLCLNPQPRPRVILDIVNTHITAPRLVKSC